MLTLPTSSHIRAALARADQEATPEAAPTTAEVLARMRPTLLRHQLAFCDNLEARKLGLVCGFGAGKTHALVAKAITMAALNIGHVSALFEPVAPMLRDILQRTMDDLLEEYGVPFTFRVSPLPEYVLTFAEGSHTILLRTMETWNRIRGQNLCAIGFDEADTANKRTAEQATRMALARLRAGNVRQFYAATTPEGRAWAFETFEKNAGPDTALIRGTSYDNPHLPADFIPSLEANYPPELVRAYVLGHWVSLTTGLVYDRFKRDKHVRELPPLLDRFGRPYQDQTPGKPCADETIILGCDFNVGNSNAALYLRRGDDFWCFDEVAKAHDTDDLGRKVRERYPDHRILMYPDASGAKRTTNASRSDIAILEGYGMSNMSPSANPPIRDRIAAAQALLENGKGETHLFVTPNCEKVIDSFELLSYDEKTGLPDKESNYDHMADAATYPLHRIRAVENAQAGRKVGSIRLY
ncbi:MAG: Cyanophage [Cyanobacteriota bacterium]